MHILPVCFVIFKFVGVWRPNHYTSYMKILYNVYSSLIAVVMYSCVLFEFIDVCINIKTIDDLTMNLFMLVTMTNACWRVTNILAGREQILKVINMLTIDYCKPGDKQEAVIKKVHDEIARIDKCLKSNTVCYAIVVQITAVLLLIAPLLHYKQERILPFRIWLPYDSSSLELFWLSYMYQVVGCMVTANVNVATDTFISGLMIQLCAQLEILKYRLINLPRLYDLNCRDEFSKCLAHCILHHEHIFKFANALEIIFSPIILVQCFASAVALCCSVYQLSKHSVDSAECASLILYFLCMLFQLFFYCWYGNQLIHKSMEVGDAVYEIDWIALKSDDSKDLLIIMKRSQQAIQIRSGPFITLSLEPFIKILKASFTAYNALQRLSN